GLDRGQARRLGERLTLAVIRRVRPGSALRLESTACEIDGLPGPVLHGKRGVFGRVGRPWRAWRLRKEQQSEKRHLRDRSLRRLGGVKDAVGHSCSPKPRSG